MEEESEGGGKKDRAKCRSIKESEENFRTLRLIYNLANEMTANFSAERAWRHEGGQRKGRLLHA